MHSKCLSVDGDRTGTRALAFMHWTLIGSTAPQGPLSITGCSPGTHVWLDMIWCSQHCTTSPHSTTYSDPSTELPTWLAVNHWEWPQDPEYILGGSDTSFHTLSTHYLLHFPVYMPIHFSFFSVVYIMCRKILPLRTMQSELARVLFPESLANSWAKISDLSCDF